MSISIYHYTLLVLGNSILLIACQNKNVQIMVLEMCGQNTMPEECETWSTYCNNPRRYRIHNKHADFTFIPNKCQGSGPGPEASLQEGCLAWPQSGHSAFLSQGLGSCP